MPDCLLGQEIGHCQTLEAPSVSHSSLSFCLPRGDISPDFCINHFLAFLYTFAIYVCIPNTHMRAGFPYFLLSYEGIIVYIFLNFQDSPLMSPSFSLFMV